MQFDLSRVDIKPFHDGDDFELKAWLDEVEVGEVQGMREGDRMKLCGIEVEDSLPRHWPLIPNRWLHRFPIRSPINLRHRGIGPLLLRRFLHDVDRMGVREIWGDVTEDDINAWSGLLAWYERHGFVVGPPDSESGPTAVRKIVRRR